jgi:hypothetical protein
MEAPSYTDTILLQANRKSSAEYLAGNNENKASWTNDLGSGIKLDIGDTISVHSAYISEIGNENSTIEIKGRNAINNVGERQKYKTKNVTLSKTEGNLNNGSATFLLESSEGNYSWDYTENEEEHTITDDTIYMTHSYYKCAQGDNYISLPRAWGANDRRGWWDGVKDWNAFNTSLTGAVNSPNPYRLGSDYSHVRTFGNASNGYGYETTESLLGEDRDEISNDGRRYTLFVRKSFKNYTPYGEKTDFTVQGEKDPALMDFIWYRKTVKYEVTKGFNSPVNIATQITNKMNAVNSIENVSLGEDQDPEDGSRKDGQIKQNNINLKAQSNTFEIFPCSTSWFIRNAGELWFNHSYSDSFNIPFIFGPLGATTYRVFRNQNTVPLCWENNGSLNGVSYTSGHMWENEQVKVGWKFKEAIRSDTGVVYTPFNNFKGSEICAIRDVRNTTAVKEVGTWVKMDTELFSLSEDVVIPEIGAGHSIYWNMSNEDLAMYYESCYSTVGFLRPEIQEYGRELMKDPSFDRYTIDNSFLTRTFEYPMTDLVNEFPSTILTQIEWTNENLLKLKNLIEAEELYPELFEYDGMSASQQGLINVDENTKSNVSPDKMRFLHMNDNKQSASIGRTFTISGSITATTLGEYIPVTDALDAQRGMRLYLTDADTGGESLYPKDTYIVKVDRVHNRIYVSNPHNPSLVVYNGFDIFFYSRGLGSDRYTDSGEVVTISHEAGAVFFDYNPARKDILEGEGGDADIYNSLTYGFAKKYLNNGKYYIGFSVKKYQNGTLPEVWFDGSDKINERCIGFDRHFNAYGTGAILLSNGVASLWGAEYSASGLDYNGFGDPTKPYSQQQFPTELNTRYRIATLQPEWDGWFFNDQTQNKYGPTPDSPSGAKLFNEIYCGANQPALSFSSDSSRFAFTNLHTAELKGTNSEQVNLGTDLGGSSSSCYKINKRLSRLNYSPNFIPYNNVFKIYDGSSFSASSTINEKDNNITPYTIMDAQAGIFIEDYGCDEDNWSQSLWELMGFTYSQFHNKGSRLQRFNNTQIDTSTPTTNALIGTQDTRDFVQRGNSGLPIYNTLELNYPSWRYDSVNGSGAAHFSSLTGYGYEALPGFQSYPPITQVDPVSTTITADNLPRKMLSPVYLIKSDLLNPTYIGGREGTSSLPVIGIVDKSSGYGDYYTGATNSTIFTNTIPRTIQNIKTSIVDADGSESRVDDGCCVIYKVTKQIKNNSVVLQNMLNPVKK